LGNQVKELMVPLEEYAILSENATLLDAVHALAEAQTKLTPDRQPHRAVLVTDAQGKIVGKVGQLAFLNVLEPQFDVKADRERLEAAGVDSELFASMHEHARLLQDDLDQLCEHARFVRLKEVMRPVSKSIAESATLVEAARLLTTEQTLSVLVTRGTKVVGLLRLSDVFETVCDRMTQVSGS
jgi:CBS-domain-containing membrane protein